MRLAIIALAFLLLSTTQTHAQDKKSIFRIARIVVDSTKLDQYRAALKEGIETAVHTEPGVLELKALYDKDNPTHITVFEVYASREAYLSHIQTAHFRKYKDKVKDMVRSLELTDVIPL